MNKNFRVYVLEEDTVRDPVPDDEKEDLFTIICCNNGGQITMERCIVLGACGYAHDVEVPGVLVKTPDDGEFLMVPEDYEINENTKVMNVDDPRRPSRG